MARRSGGPGRPSAAWPAAPHRGHHPLLFLSSPGAAIYAVDVHPAGTRFATGGGDGRVRVWAAAPLLDARAEADAASPRLLATLAGAPGSVNALRFSPDGTRLAAGFDDGVAAVYELRAGPGAAAALGETPPVENWRAVAHLRGHSNNVTDIAWSPDGERLATASLDNRVGIWSGSTGAHAAWLDGHTSYVKGVAWDPVGKYVASQGDDGRMLVWAVDGWARSATVADPFKGGATITSSFAARPSWAPDGAFVVACNAFSEAAGAHLAPLVARGGAWAAGHQLVGHTGAVVASRCAPVQFRAGTEGDKAPPATLVALGAQDGRVSIWSTASARPAVVVARLFTQSVVDLAWTPDGHALLAVSTDGGLACLQFERGEVGRPLSKAAAAAHLRSLYGDARARTALFAETAGQLALEAGPAAGAAPGLAARLAPAAGSRAALAAPRRAAPAGAALARPPASLAPPPAPLAAPPASPDRAPGAKRPRGAARPAPHPVPPAPLLPALAVPLPSPAGGSSAPAGVVDAANPRPAPPGAARGAAAVGVSRAGVRSWDDAVPGAVTALAASAHFVAAATDDGTLIVWSPAGRRLLPPAQLSAPPSALAARGWRLLSLTADGGVKVYDIAERALALSCSLAPLVARAGGAPVSARLSDAGLPLAILADGTAAAFDPALDAWLRVADGSFPGSGLAPARGGAPPAGELACLLAGAPAAASADAGLAALTSSRGAGRETRADAETRAAAALALRAGAEWRDATLTCVRLLTDDADEGRLRELLGELLGPVRLDGSSGGGDEPTADAPASWAPAVGGVARRAVLKEALVEASRNRAVQRLVAEFGELLAAAG